MGMVGLVALVALPLGFAGCGDEAHGSADAAAPIGDAAGTDALAAPTEDAAAVLGPASPVAGTWITTFMNGRVRGERPADLSDDTLGVWSGARFIKGTGAADGSFVVPDVPAGPFILAYGTDASGFTMVASDGGLRVFDLGASAFGNPDRSLPLAAKDTRIELSLTNLVPWTAGDEISLYRDIGTSWLFRYSDRMAGATQLSLTLELGERPGFDGPGRGDEVLILQSGTTALPDGGRFSTARAGTASRALRSVDGQAVMATEALAALPADGVITVDLKRASFAAQAPAGTKGDPDVTLAISRSPTGLGDLGARRTALLTWPAGTADIRAEVRETNPYPLEWTRTADAWVSFPVSTFVPGVMRPLVTEVSLRVVDRAEVLLAGTITPRLGPPQTPTIAGRPATTAQTGVGLTPLVSWTAPALGQPTLYRLVVRRIDARVLDASEVTRATISTSGTEVRLPPGVLKPGETYRFIVRALAGDAARLGSVNRTSLPWAQAEVSSGLFSP